MADRYLLESGGVDGFLLEDGTGVLLLDMLASNASGIIIISKMRASHVVLAFLGGVLMRNPKLTRRELFGGNIDAQ